MKLGKRGTGGESSLSTDSTYDISNLARLGQSEVFVENQLEPVEGKGVSFMILYLTVIV